MARHPNIIVILADDMGYGDAHCFDPDFSKIPTPNIDRLASEGMMFTDAHAPSALCTPSRYGLLTGRYAWRSSLQRGVLTPYDPPLIDADRLTVPALLKQAGYDTACIGKWHLGWDWPERDGKHVYNEPIAGGPTTRGFDYYFGDDVPNYPPYAFIENDRLQGDPTGFVDKDPVLVLNHPGDSVPDWQFDAVMPTLVDRIVSYIGDRAANEDPFFLFFPLTTPHEPVAPSPEFAGKSGISGVADLIMESDWAVGEVMRALSEHGIADDTLLLFTTDNGHCVYTDLNPFEQAGHRVSGPYRGYKADIWEGGHRVPFVARWPGEIEPGSACNEPLCLTDVMATCAEIAGREIPQDAGEDSLSFLPLLRGASSGARSETVYHSGKGYFAVFRGPWKLALCPGGGGYGSRESPPAEDAPPVQLYNIDEDPGERNNLIDKHPEMAPELISYLRRVVSEGRSTPGAPRSNDVPVDIWKDTPADAEERYDA